jgi:hypothetical protein
VTLAAGPMVTPWLTIPLAAIGLILLAGYTLAIQRDDVPLARRKVRTALGVLNMFIIAAFTYGVSIANPADQKAFAVCWMLVVGLVVVSVLLAVLDAAITVRIAVRERRADARRAADELAAAVLKARDERASAPTTPRGPGA